MLENLIILKFSRWKALPKKLIPTSRSCWNCEFLVPGRGHNNLTHECEMKVPPLDINLGFIHDCLYWDKKLSIDE